MGFYYGRLLLRDVRLSLTWSDAVCIVIYRERVPKRMNTNHKGFSVNPLTPNWSRMVSYFLENSVT